MNQNQKPKTLPPPKKKNKQKHRQIKPQKKTESKATGKLADKGPPQSSLLINACGRVDVLGGHA